MKQILHLAAITSLAIVLFVGSLVSISAQDQGGRGGGRGGNFDPEQMRAMMMQRMQESLDINDEEWKVIQPLVENVMEKQRQNQPGIRGMGFMGFGGPGGPGGPGAFGGRGGRGGEGGQNEARENRRGGFGPEPNPELEALSTLMESPNPSADEIKAKLTALRESQKKKAEELKKAREELRSVLTLNQEARLVLMGMLD